MYDLLIHNARIVDGTGSPAFIGHIGVDQQRITAISADHLGEDAHHVMDADGMVIAPGFVDAHTHDDLVVLRSAIVPAKVQQGITTLVIGNCGFSIAPTIPAHADAIKTYSASVLGRDEQAWDWPTMGAFLDTLRTRPLGQNVCALMGHTALRVAVMGFEQRAATAQEISTQQALIAEAMQAGAVGLSLGLMYIPGLYTPTTEITSLAHVVGQYDGVVAVHMRGEGDTLLNSLDEMITMAQQAEVAVHISHLKVIGRKNWGTIQRALDRIVDARSRGLDITVDVYPYTAGSTTITQLLPPWVQEGGMSRMLERLRNPIMQQRVYQDFANGITGWENQVGSIGWERVYIAGVQQEQHRMLEGLNIAEIADRFGQSPEQAFFHLLLEEQGQITVTLFLMDEQDVDQVVQSAFSMLGSDGLPIASGRPHPRLYGTFPRYIRRYVRELKYMSLEQAIHKITAFPAARFGLADRGEIAIGKIADLVLFDPDGISDEATYNNPRIYPQGIAAVIVAGQPVVLNKQLQAPLPGRLLTSVHPD